MMNIFAVDSVVLDGGSNSNLYGRMGCDFNE